MARPGHLDGDSFNDVSCDSSPPTVVKMCSPGIGVASQVLDVFQRDSLGKQVGDRGDAEGMR